MRREESRGRRRRRDCLLVMAMEVQEKGIRWKDSMVVGWYCNLDSVVLGGQLLV